MSEHIYDFSSKLLAFILHFSASILMIYATIKCGKHFVVDTFSELDDQGYPVISNATCRDIGDKSCFLGLPESYDSVQGGLELNVFAILAAFEWISASFSLGHLFEYMREYYGDRNYAMLCLIWNAVGFVLFLINYGKPLTLLQVSVTGMALFVASFIQFYPPMGSQVVMHYTEYCTSASLLFVAVLILYIPDPPSWAVIVGFTGILLCNLSGVAAHMCKVDQCNSENVPGKFDLDWGKCMNHFKLFFLHAWLGLLMGILIIVYLARNSFTNDHIPWWVRFILMNLLVTYTLFGIWASVCYFLAGDGRDQDQFERWTNWYLGFGLTVLSAAAKLPIAFTVFYGLLQEPGGDKVCSVF